jgi:putative transposase
LGVNRSTLYRYKVRQQERKQTRKQVIDEVMAKRIYGVIQKFPSYGWRKVWAILRFRDGIEVNKKKVHRIMKIKGWLVSQRVKTPRPRVKARRSRTKKSNERWAIDVTHVKCGRDGWGHLTAIIDCCDREIVGFEFAMRGRAKEAERALEEACINRFGVLYPKENGPLLRSDNGLIFQSRRFRDSCRAHKLRQEFITPYTPEQNGMIERFFRSLKEECVWLQNFDSFEEANKAIREWIRWYNKGRPHQSLGYLSPTTFRQQQVLLVA